MEINNNQTPNLPDKVGIPIRHRDNNQIMTNHQSDNNQIITRKSNIRLKKYDYSQSNYYFITACCENQYVGTGPCA
ncbi:MAG: hypothetical protein V1709_11800, partial [Planctomycetota bacterium]